MSGIVFTWTATIGTSRRRISRVSGRRFSNEACATIPGPAGVRIIRSVRRRRSASAPSIFPRSLFTSAANASRVSSFAPRSAAKRGSGFLDFADFTFFGRFVPRGMGGVLRTVAWRRRPRRADPDVATPKHPTRPGRPGARVDRATHVEQGSGRASGRGIDRSTDHPRAVDRPAQLVAVGLGAPARPVEEDPPPRIVVERPEQVVALEEIDGVVAEVGRAGEALDGPVV